MTEKTVEIKEKLKKLLSLWIEESRVEELDIATKLDEKGVLVEVNGPQEVLSLIIGKNGQTVNAIRTILKSVGGSLQAAISLKVQTTGERVIPRSDSSDSL
ncbi:MAG: KH domain-containing protein [Patescibacteria group bacterium]